MKQYAIHSARIIGLPAGKSMMEMMCMRSRRSRV